MLPYPPVSVLLGFFVKGMLPAESAILFQFHSVRVILLVFLGIVVSLLAFAANKRNLNSHVIGTS